MSDTLDVAIVGLGEAGADLHLPALESISGARVIALCDPSMDARAAAGRVSSAPSYSSLSDALAESTPDLVVVATPPDGHANLATMALEHGAHVLLEKPVASSLREMDHILSLAAERNLLVGANHEFKEMPIFRSVLDRVRSGSDGAPSFVQLQQHMYRPPGSEPGWRARLRERSLFEAGAHLVDFALAVFGEAPLAVQSVLSPAGTASVDGIVVLTVEFPGDRVAVIVQNRVAPGERRYFDARVDLSSATLHASFGGRAALTLGKAGSARPGIRLEFGQSGVAWREEGATRRQIARNPANPNVVGTRVVLEGTLEAIRTGGTPPTPGPIARSVLEVIVAAYRSARLGRRIVLSDERDELVDERLGVALTNGP